MANQRELDPTKSAKDHYGHRLRRHRTRRGWTQPQLAERVCCSDDLISKIETGVNVATHPMSIRFDSLFDLDGEFADLQPLAAKEIIPWWFRPYTDFESIATAIRIFDPLHIPGIFQIEPYARRILAARHSGTALDEVVSARMGRQSILTGKNPPWVFALIAEWALRRPVGDVEVQRQQLEHLLEIMNSRRISIYAVPSEPPDFVSSGFTIFSFADEPDIAYVDGAIRHGRPINKRDDVEEYKVEYDLIRDHALSTTDSSALIRSIVESL